MVCIGVIFPREAEGSGMLLVHPGSSGELAVPCVPRAGTGVIGLRDGNRGRRDGLPYCFGLFCCPG